MRCLNPLTIKNPKNKVKTVNEKGEKIASVKFIRPSETEKLITVPCGKCNFCMSNNSKEFAQRMINELKEADSAMFLGITYDDENLHIVKNENGSYQGTLRKKDLQLFIKKLRYENERLAKKRLKVSSIKEARKHIKPIKYYAIGEYGHNTYRPHYHILVYNLEPELTRRDKKRDRLDEIWEKGQINKGHGNGVEGGIGYCTKYMIKMDTQKFGPKQELPFAMISNKIGFNYIEKHRKWHVDNVAFYVIKQIKGKTIKMALAKYYKDKIFNQAQINVQNEKAEKERWKKEDKEEARLIKLGYNREQRVKYGQQQTMQAYKKITEKALKNAKL